MESIRKLSFAIKGMWSFGKSGYTSAKQNFDPKALDVDLKGKVYIVTGSNSGLVRITFFNK